jgi:putative ABC transport system permease protein
MDKFFGADFIRVGNRINLKLEPLTSIYFNNDTRYERGVVHGNKTYLYIFSCVGVLLVILAAINYMNLATALAATRSKEVGVRKTLGSSRGAVATQFFTESFVLGLSSFLVAMVIVELSVPLFRQQFGIALGSLSAVTELWWVGLLLVFVLTLLSGSYPALLLSGFKPVSILSGKIPGGIRFALLRKSLVVFQFAISISMIIATLIIGSQLQYLREKDLGFQGDQVLRIRMNNEVINSRRKSFKDQIESLRGVRHASLASGQPGGFFDATTVRVEGIADGTRMRTLWTDDDFLSTLDLSIVEGRWFSRDFPADSTSSVVLNETAIAELGWQPEDAIGKRVQLAQFDSTFRTVVGVVKDFHFLPLHQKIEPLIISYESNGIMLVNISGSDVLSVMASLQSTWDSFGSGFPMEWALLDDLMNTHYHNEEVQAKVFSLFSVLSLMIGALGIFGLTSYLASQRKQEISIRKVLGASTQQLSFMLVKDLLALVLLAAIISIPFVYLSLDKWLQNFAYRVTPGVQSFLLGGGIVVLFALLVAVLKASSAASENPAENLRNY